MAPIGSIGNTQHPISLIDDSGGGNRLSNSVADGIPAQKRTPQGSLKDKVNISPEAHDLSRKNQSTSAENPAVSNSNQGRTAEMDAEQQSALLKLQQRDSEVRRHEQAHLAAAGGYARGGASFTYTKGPDGRFYAVGGEVGIDVSKESTPEATILKMQTIKRAALAPATPSSTDRRIAAQASVKEAQARREIATETQQDLLRGETVDNSIPNENSTGDDSASAISSLDHKIAIYNTIHNGL